LAVWEICSQKFIALGLGIRFPLPLLISQVRVNTYEYVKNCLVYNFVFVLRIKKALNFTESCYCITVTSALWNRAFHLRLWTGSFLSRSP